MRSVISSSRRLEPIVPSTAAFSFWTMANGTLSESDMDGDPQVGLKGIFIRGLAEARRRNPGTALAKYIESFISVQVCLSSHTGRRRC